MILGDVAISSIIKKGYVQGENLEQLINPASLNIRLGDTFLIPKSNQTIMLGESVEYERFRTDRNPNKARAIMPGQFILGTTLERLELPNNLSAFVQGRSSIGRIGLTIQNAGFVDPGFHGHITLELINDSPNPIFLIPGYPVGQLVFFETSEVQNPYNGKYNGQIEATGSRMFMDNFEKGYITND